MKKILVILLVCLLLVGCKKKEEPKVTEPELASDEVILEGIKYKLDQDDTGYDLKYKIASNFRRSNMINAINYFGQKINDSDYFVFRIFQYKNKDIEYAIKDSTTEYDNRHEEVIGDKTYTVVHFTNYNGANTYLYYYRNNKDTYAFCFTANIDLSRLANIFISNVEYPM